ncbi:MAG: SPOR domain-containing protein [Sedimenticola sp.]|nr:SPOR domain-containing protein [Sedimenticola sp.]
MKRPRSRWLLSWLLLAAPAAAMPGDPVEAGYQAFEQEQWQTAYEYAVLPAGQGDPRAQYLLSRLFSEGHGVPADPVTALTFLTFAARGDHPQAQYRLGNHYHRGELMERDPVLAHQWWQRAAEQGVIEAQLRLAAAYALGLGVERDRERAIGWYRRAAEQGSAEAAAILSRDGFPVLAETPSVPGDYSRVSDGRAEDNSQRVAGYPVAAKRESIPWQHRVSGRSVVVESIRLSGGIPNPDPVLANAASVPAVPSASELGDDDWFARQPAEYFTLQLFSSDKRHSAERVARQLNSDLPVAIFSFNRFGYRWFGVLAGSFEGIEQARVAREVLLQNNSLEQPWIRRFRSVRKSEPQSKQVSR